MGFRITVLNVLILYLYPLVSTIKDCISDESAIKLAYVDYTVTGSVFERRTSIGANVPMDIHVEVFNKAGERIRSGPDSRMTIFVVASEGVQLAVDFTSFHLAEGHGWFRGSVCSATKGTAKLKFKGTNSKGIVIESKLTAEITITDVLNIANFIDSAKAGGGAYVEPHMESFALFAVNDINAGTVYPNLLINRTLKLKKFATIDKFDVTVDHYETLKAIGKKNPIEKVLGIIGFGDIRLTTWLSLNLKADGMPLITIRESSSQFSNKDIFPNLVRLSWSDRNGARSLFLIAKSRNWNKIVIIKTGQQLGREVYEEAENQGIKIVSEIEIPIRRLKGAGDLVYFMELIKQANTKIIFSYIDEDSIAYILREAYREELSCQNGYQWVMTQQFFWQFPFRNRGDCRQEPICTVAYTGLLGFTPTYKLDGYASADWLRVMGHHITSDRAHYKGIASFPKPTVAAEYALAYDAVHVYSQAMDAIIKKRETLTGEKIALTIRKVNFNGLTGPIQFTENGDRIGYRGFIININPKPPKLNTDVEHVTSYIRMIQMINGTSYHELMEYVIQDPEDKSKYVESVLPKSSIYNKRPYNSSSGMFSIVDEEIIPIPPSTDAPTEMVRIELAVAPFYCSRGCGGAKTDTDITVYQHGTCISMNKCSCKHGYFGEACKDFECKCNQGNCTEPNVCICKAGWKGSHCQLAVCIPPCKFGSCALPNYCVCKVGYSGSSCEKLLSKEIIYPIVGFSFVILTLLYLASGFSKQHTRRLLMSNMDWIVKWRDCTTLHKMNETSATGRIVEWRNSKYFAQFFNIDTLNIKDDELRLEFVYLMEIQHINLIQFVGACLEAPNVFVLTEYAIKGSLQDLLSNSDVKLHWDIKFSFLKDICSGMDFLHKSEIGSHGRLKSRNCLVDRKWTCKITGYGIPTMRYIHPKHTEVSTDPALLLWTAPEFLQTCQSLDKIGSGTKSGDVYAFTIILTEICNRQLPFTHELKSYSAKQIIDKIRGSSTCLSELTRRNSDDQFRPQVLDTCLPPGTNKRKGMRKLFQLGWHGNPFLRPPFSALLLRLNEIHTVEGNLMDNMIEMLETYSHNLEERLATRTKEFQIEKAKTDKLLSQMLPIEVQELLKHDQKVAPQSFECVTIFFSDIVGFTEMNKNRSPLDVVNLLNTVYMTFDDIVNNYDVYKVEAIGDVYMVVSGLPTRNGNRHAGEIATMSLDLLSSVTEFKKIRNMPKGTLQLRIGMHSGPVVGCVVGLKMPRYCLFGDTVNTSSRMQSSSLALRIHMSSTTAEILKGLGGYELEWRGQRQVKGIGIMTTYWLKSKEGFKKKLPNMALAMSESRHQFK